MYMKAPHIRKKAATVTPTPTPTLSRLVKRALICCTWIAPKVASSRSLRVIWCRDASPGLARASGPSRLNCRIHEDQTTPGSRRVTMRFPHDGPLAPDPAAAGEPGPPVAVEHVHLANHVASGLGVDHASVADVDPDMGDPLVRGIGVLEEDK